MTDRSETVLPYWRLGRWRLHEPATTITDMLLGGLAITIGLWIAWAVWAGMLGLSLPIHGIALGDLPLTPRLVVARVTAMSVALGAIGAAAQLGAWVHGGGSALSARRRSRLWAAIAVCMACAATMLYAVAALLALELPIPSLRWLGVGAIAATTGLSWFAVGSGQRRGAGFASAQLNLGVAALAVAILAGLRAAASPGQWTAGFARAWWTGCAIYVFATLLQRRRIGLGRHFDHNAVYHVLQAAAIFALGYVAAGSELGILVEYLVGLVE